MKNIHLVLIKKPKNVGDLNFQNMLVRYLIDNFKEHKINVVYTNYCLNESKLVNIEENDFVIFTPILASINLDLVQKIKNSVIAFENKTVYLQRISEKNPINENVAIHRDIKIMYLTDFEDKTNEDWKLVIEPNIIDVEFIKQNLLCYN